MINLSEFHNYVARNQSNICQMTIIQNEKTIINDTWNGYKVDDTVHTMSVTKSIVSLLIGIAIEQGLIGSVDDYVLDYFPEYKIKRGEKTIQKVTLKNLLTMTAPYKYKSEPWSKICVQEDWSIAALDFLGGRRGITGEFQYSTLGIHILTGIITAVSKMTTVDFANKFLFEPLSIAPRKMYVAPDAEAHKAFTIGKTPKGEIWFSDNKGVGAAGYGLCLSADEMAKIGLLCLKKGIFNNKRVVSEKWLKESIIVRLCCGKKYRDMKYGYLWWIIDENEGSYPLKGKVYCGCCDHALSRIAQKKPFYMCRHSTADVNSRCHTIRADAAGLEEAVLITLKKQLEILLPAHEDGTLHLDATAAKCSEYEKQLEDLRDQKQALFERYLLGQIELDTYKSRKTDYDAEIRKVKNAYAAVTAQAKLKREEQARQSNRQEIVHSIAEADALTSELTDLLIEKVYIFPDNRIEIVYKVHDLFE